MDFKTLEYYRKIYEKRSIRQAAAELYISPQGLSRTLYALEEELQVRLFERSVKGLEPTRAGELFLPGGGKASEKHASDGISGAEPLRG